ncbi:hypothetical protein [Neorhodopirellula pilleata]|uniref:Uncharacterized protein n=1 Tax=Neorhodopirellula pilleata TaxID=2714738 RepID=A0A5C5ZWS3_9BACT|nr:hypothetical protein [Neorhodopirellula pilleata]TWT91417.1 hypothetical protein Pla100_52670 [Neorhodopirellula pilleata]TWT91466.1 hypothetical protein Pla100_53160 [Neorhodopirellula pilleata]
MTRSLSEKSAHKVLDTYNVPVGMIHDRVTLMGIRLEYAEKRAAMKEPKVFKPHWPEGLEAMKRYEILCDDDGNRCGSQMNVMVDNQGDVYVGMHAYHDEERTAENLDPFPSIRIRTGIGGGRNRRTRQALLWLAKAIELDSQSNEGCLG